MHLARFDPEQFLRHTWQRMPLLIPNAWDAWDNPLEPDELAGLACEPGVESRLMIQARDRWQLEHGPLPEQRFTSLGRDPWTLLVQSVDHHVSAVADLLDAFRFIPNWRVDDVMVSYAVDGGGVGPHFDHYDVFLIQGLGHRRWQIGPRCDRSTPLLPHDDVRLLADFQPTDEWVLGPGDMLYVPPGFGHNGIAVSDDCMTYSIGFRAPSRAELIAGWADHLVADLVDDDRYADPGLAAPHNPGEISPAALHQLRAMVTERMVDADTFARWFGEYSTAPKTGEFDWRPEQRAARRKVRSSAERGIPLRRNPASRFAFVRGDGGGVLLFVDGRAHDCIGPSAAFAERLCAADGAIVPDGLAETDEGMALIVDLLDRGSVMFEVEE